MTIKYGFDELPILNIRLGYFSASSSSHLHGLKHLMSVSISNSPFRVCLVFLSGRSI